MQLPTGTVTFLFTDIEGSTRLWEERPVAMRESLARHDALLRSSIESHNGFVFKTVGDAFCAAFANAPDALAAAVAAQRSLNSAPAEVNLKVRMALHAGLADERDGDYFGPTLNRVARLLSAGHGGQVLLSQEARDALPEEKLPSDVRLADQGSHRLKDLQQPGRIYQLRATDLPGDFPPLRSLGNTNLPIQLTSFIGREAEIRDVRNLLSTSRLVTLLGTGGIGKTRLSLQVAAEMMEEFPDGVWLVELAALTEPGLVPKAVAAVLGVADEPGRPLVEALADYLRPKSLLLILDNCEHLIAACASLAGSLVRACPGVKILASSREPLNIPEEQPWRIPSLLPPDPDHLPTGETDLVAAVGSSDAVRLFVERAAIQRLDFRLDARNARAVANICRRLDGIPLALELAAARVRGMTTEQIAARLDDSFRLLTAGSRAALPRQQTLRALLDWSYDLLDSRERALLHRVSVFAGGWTLEAAETVCAGDAIDGWDVVDLLTSLVDKSLVLFEEPDGVGRYRLLETVRQYGREKLAEEGQTDSLRSRHAAFFLELAEEANKNLMGPEQAAWCDRLETEHDNLRAALDWYLLTLEGATPGLRLSGALQRFWWVRGHMTEGRQRVAAALAKDAAAEPTAERALALQGAGNLAFQQTDLNEARRCYQQVLEIREAIGDRPGTAGSLASLGNVAHYQGDYPRARLLFEESLVITRETGNKGWEAACLAALCNLTNDMGDSAAALDYSRQSLAMNRANGNREAVVYGLTNLGIVLQWMKDMAGARAAFSESLSMSRDLKDARSEASNLLGLAGIAQAEGDIVAARAYLVEGMVLVEPLSDKRMTVSLLEGFALSVLLEGRPELAARLLGTSEAVREEIGVPIPGRDREDYDQVASAAREALGPERFASMWAEGHAMALEEAVAAAMGV